ncbi:MAG: SpoIVB peptidase S55 domain-containing protein [Planctomycetota bacterium]
MNCSGSNNNMSFRWSVFPSIAAVLAVVLSVLPAQAGEAIPWDPARYMDVDEIKPGMRGAGKSVFQGTVPVEFEFEVLGIEHNPMPQYDLILFRASGRNLEKTGVVAGMSGSPLYLNGRLIGAVAYAGTFALEPIGWATPIRRMLEIPSFPARKAGAVMTAPDSRGMPLVRSNTGRLDELITPGYRYARDARMGGGRIALLPLAVAGIPDRMAEDLRLFFEPLGFLPVPAASAGGGAPAEAADLVPGSAVAAMLIRGDWEMSAVGTVTERVGDRILAFGHPFMMESDVDFPMGPARVNAVFPSSRISMKLAVPLASTGRFVTDSAAGIYGEIGKPSVLVPVSVQVEREGRTERYRYEVVDHPDLTPALARYCAAYSLFSRNPLPAELTVSYRSRIDLGKDGSVILENTTTGGPFGAAYDMGFALNVLLRNPFVEVRVSGVTVELRIESRNRAALIEKIAFRKNVVRPGGVLAADVTLRPFRGDVVTVPLEFAVPADLPEGNHVLVICDSGSNLQMEYQEAPGRFIARNFKDLTALLQKDYPANRMYARLTLPRAGIVVRDQEFRSLPPSIRSVITSTSETGVLPLGTSLVKDYLSDYVVQGCLALPFLVSRKDVP